MTLCRFTIPLIEQEFLCLLNSITEKTNPFMKSNYFSLINFPYIYILYNIIFLEYDLTRVYNSLGTIMHELLHTLGFWHEQSRPDRDYHIKINEDNIIPSMKHNFKKQEGQTQNAPYDTCSIMHYNSNTFRNQV